MDACDDIDRDMEEEPESRFKDSWTLMLVLSVLSFLKVLVLTRSWLKGSCVLELW